MKRNPASLVLVACASILVTVSLFGQGLSPKKIWNLTVTVNVPGAAIYVDNVPVQGNTAKVTGGPHNVRVQADGYFDFVGPVNVTGHMTFPVQLEPQGFPLTIRVNVPDAAIYVDGEDVTGTVPYVTGGPHNVQVSARGYTEYNSVIKVAGAMSLDVSLRPLGFPLTVNANVPTATVTVNNVGKGGVPYSENLPPGTYTLRVSANGFADYIANIALDKPITLNVQLQRQMGFPLTVNANVPTATVTVNNVPKGGVPYAERLPPGTYRLRVSANGFADYNATIALNKPVSLNVQLQPLGFPLTINANVSTATVTVNNVVKGGVPYVETLPPGTYRLRVSANGFDDYDAAITLDKPITLNVQLHPQLLPPTLSLVIPPAFLDRDVRPGDPQGVVRIFVDNRLANPQWEMDFIQVFPGRHRIRVASGAFSVQLGDFDFQMGMSYVIELSMDLKVRGMRSAEQ